VLLVLAAPSLAAAQDEDGGYPEFAVSLTGPAGPIPKGQTADYVTTVVNRGTGSGVAELQHSSYKVDGDKPVPNPYIDFAVTGGSCARNQWDTKFGTYYYLDCTLGPLAPNEAAEVRSTVQINESMRHSAFVDFGDMGRDQVTTLVDAPPEISGSNKIKVSGLPNSCASSPFTLKATAKGAKKILATLRGPLNAEGKPPNGGFSNTEGLGSSNGKTLKAKVDAGSLEPAYYEIKLSAKYQTKPKQKSSVFFQVCG
jgi:hypothetical protein